MSRKPKYKEGDQVGNFYILRCVGKNSLGFYMHECRCALCGKVSIRSSANVRRSRSCGCLRIKNTKRRLIGRPSPKRVYLDETAYTLSNAERQVKYLPDSYVVALVAKDCSIGSKDIPQSLINLKREQILFGRELRKLNKLIKEMK